jgi:trimeric autotransporter adhesin
MSTKTTFKRIALVAVAALGLGVLSVAPSNAAVINLSATTVTVANGTATTGTSDSRTAAEITISFTSEGSSDSVSVTSYVSARPAAAAAVAQTSIVVHLVDTSTSTSAPTVGFRDDSVTVRALSLAATSNVRGDSATTIIGASGTAFTAAKLKYYFLTASALSAGTYTITSVVTPFSAGVKGTAFTKDVNIVVTAADNNSTSLSTAHIGGSDVTVWGAETDTVSLVKANTAKTAFADRAATVKITQLKATGAAANESVTATITGPGTLGCGTASAGNSAGRALTCHTDGSGVAYVHVFGDGSSGTASISLKGTTSGYDFGTKKVLFSGTTIAKLTAKAVNAVVATSGNSKTGAVSVVATDADGYQIYSPTVYTNSSATTVASNAYSTAGCTWDADDLVTYCDVTPVAAGTANITFTNRASATATTPTTEVVSNAVAIRVGSTTPATAKLAFDKATYAPGEKATLTLTLLDSTGNAVAGSDEDNSTYAAVWATGGISADYSFYTGSDTLTATFANIDEATGVQTWTLFMPLQAAELTVTGTTGTKFAVANQAVKVTAKAAVGNSAGVDAATDAANEATDAANAATDAALAAADAADAATAAAQDASDAVAALSASVSKLISSLRAQITSLTNLVIKIQKKVKA